MVNMNAPMDEKTEKALAGITSDLIEAHVVFKDDLSELDVNIYMGEYDGTQDDDNIFYYCENTDDLRSLLKGAPGWETNNNDFYITSFSDGIVEWNAD